MYRGTLNYERFLASLLFTDAACSFVRNYSTSFFINIKHKNAQIWKEFVTFINNNGRYDFLGDYFMKNDLVTNVVGKDSPPPYEDYLSKRIPKLVILTGEELIQEVRKSGLEKYIIDNLTYEFVKEEFDKVNMRDITEYMLMSKAGIPKWIVPRNIARVCLEKKKGITAIKMAEIIILYLNTGVYLLRVYDPNGRLYKEVGSVLDLFRDAINENHGIYQEGIIIARQLKDFILANNFRYEIIKNDAINAYNRKEKK